MAKNVPIGQLLEEAGIINKEQIEVALDAQKVSQKFFGEILQELDFVTSTEIAEVIAIQNNLEFIDLDTVVPSQEALKLVPKDIVISKKILPISIDEENFIVATTNANDLMTLDYLRKVSNNKNIKFVIGDESAIVHYIEIYYYQLENPIEVEIDNFIKEFYRKKSIANLPRLVDLLINTAIKDRATDIHITPEKTAIHVFYRVDGVLQHFYALPSELHLQIVSRIKILSDLDISEQRHPQDGAFSYNFFNEEFDIRVSTLPTNFGENIVLRILEKNSSLFNISQLGINQRNLNKIQSYFLKPYGVVLIAGPTGSGKTTTLYSALRKINPLKKNIMTIEDPIEYRFSFIRQTQLNVKSGYTFATAMKAFMRQDPDVMLVGEIRDEETAELAIRASITGHLVLSTIHTNDAVGTIPRLADMKIENYLIASGLLAVIAQRLVRKLCPYCKEKVEFSQEELLQKGISKEQIESCENIEIYKAKGCRNCRNTGYSGRAAIVEILEIDEEMKTLITKGASTQEIFDLARKKGMVTMKEDGFEKILQGITTFNEVERVVN